MTAEKKTKPRNTKRSAAKDEATTPPPSKRRSTIFVDEDMLHPADVVQRAAYTERRVSEIYEDENERAFTQFMEAQAGLGIDPLSDEAVQLQAKYVALGTHPFDVLKRIVANPFCAVKERISASKILLEYTARKVPAELKVDGKASATLQLTASQLSRLSGDELDALEKILTKLQITEKKDG